MRSNTRYLSMLFAVASACASIAVAPVASAAPECISTGPNTTQCQTNGSAQIVTSPPPMNNYGGWGPYWGGGGLVISFGGFGW